MRAACRLLLLALLTSPCALADTVYIGDTLYVPLRGGQSTEHRILHRGLRSGTALERLEQNDTTGYTRVRTPGGLEGWLQSQYLVDTPIAAARVEQLDLQLESLEATHQQTLLRLREANELNDSLNQRTESLGLENEQLQADLQQVTALAADVIAIDQQNQQMAEDRQNLLAEINALQRQNESLADESARQWFLWGAGVVLISLLFGFVIGRRIYNRRHSGGWA